jgi:hypothetical protein
MRRSSALILVSLGVGFAAACSSSSSNSTGNDSGGASSGGGGSGGNDSGNTGPSSGGSSSSSGGVPVGEGGINWTCMSAADCTEGGAGQVCCLSLMASATSCVANQCAMGDYQQCAGSDSECPSGNVCMMAPAGYQGHYCAPGGDGGGATGGDGGGRDGGARDGGNAQRDAGGTETGTGDGATE